MTNFHTAALSTVQDLIDKVCPGAVSRTSGPAICIDTGSHSSHFDEESWRLVDELREVLSDWSWLYEGWEVFGVPRDWHDENWGLAESKRKIAAEARREASERERHAQGLRWCVFPEADDRAGQYVRGVPRSRHALRSEAEGACPAGGVVAKAIHPIQHSKRAVIDAIVCGHPVRPAS